MNFMETNKPFVMNTFFRKKAQRKWTYQWHIKKKLTTFRRQRKTY